MLIVHWLTCLFMLQNGMFHPKIKILIPTAKKMYRFLATFEVLTQMLLQTQAF